MACWEDRHYPVPATSSLSPNLRISGSLSLGEDFQYLTIGGYRGEYARMLVQWYNGNGTMVQWYNGSIMVQWCNDTMVK